MNYNLTLKGHFKNLTWGQGHDLFKKVMMHISRSVWSFWTQIRCLRCFHRFSWCLSKVIAEKLTVTFLDLKCPWGHEEGSLGAIFQFRVWIIPVTRCLRVFRMGFVQNRRFSIFLNWLGHKKWPELRPPISKFLDMHLIHCYLYQSLKLSRQSFSRCSFEEHSNFVWGEVTWRNLVTWPCVTWVLNFNNMRGKDVW